MQQEISVWAFNVDYLDVGNIYVAAVSDTVLNENPIKLFPHMIWICIISIDLESLIANAAYFRFPFIQRQESFPSSVYQAYSQEGFGNFFILTRLCTLGKTELLVHIKQLLPIQWQQNNT